MLGPYPGMLGPYLGMLGSSPGMAGLSCRRTKAGPGPNGAGLKPRPPHQPAYGAPVVGCWTEYSRPPFEK